MRPGKNECIHERVNEQTGEYVKEQVSGFVGAGWVSDKAGGRVGDPGE